MFGLFGKKELENESFNNLLIATLGELVRKQNRLPNSDSEYFGVMEPILNKKNAKLTQQQIRSIRSCSISMQMGLGDEILPLVEKMNKEVPSGIMTAKGEIYEELCRHAIISEWNTTGDIVADFQKILNSRK